MAQPNSSQTGASSGGGTAAGTSYASHTGSSGGKRDTTLVDRVRERAEATLESQKDRATEGLGSVARAVRSTEEQLRSQHQESIADYVAQVAGRIDRFSEQLRDKRVHELLDDAQRFARRHPAAFAGSAFALGLVTARFLKSSGDQGDNGFGYDDDADGEHGESGYAAPYRSLGQPKPQESANMASATATGAGVSGSGNLAGSSGYGSPSSSTLAGSGNVSAGRSSAGASGPVDAGTGGTATTGTRTGSPTASGTSSGTAGSPRGRRTGAETERP